MDEFGIAYEALFAENVKLKEVALRDRECLVNLLKELKTVRWQRDEFERLSQSWMRDYDKLKAKYEPVTVSPSHPPEDIL